MGNDIPLGGHKEIHSECHPQSDDGGDDMIVMMMMVMMEMMVINNQP